MALAIITLSAVVRLCLLPLNLKIGRLHLAQQALMRKLQPEMDRLREKFKNRPERIAKETMALFKKYDAKMIDGRTLFGGLIQLPIVVGIYSAIRDGIGAGGRFLWIKDISKPDFWVALIVGALTYLMMHLTPNLTQENRAFFTMVPAIISVVLLLNIASGIGLYWGTSTLIGIFEKLILRYSLRRYPVPHTT